jgi:hypothetical protein
MPYCPALGRGGRDNAILGLFLKESGGSVPANKKKARGHMAGEKEMTTSTFRNGKRNGKFRDGDVTTGRLPADLFIASPAVPQRSRGETDKTVFPQHAETPVMGAGTKAVMPGSRELRPPGGDAG